ncbi:MAG TPA: DUF2071 domain-containing protein [Candidatus Dormibacteraeota bacterium]|nr:DUF2071 domain-containing protein [Candidatus Dormibacteraeota bacterium]
MVASDIQREEAYFGTEELTATRSLRTESAAGLVSATARQRMRAHPGEPFLLADWLDVLMIHLEVDQTALQQATPFELDLFDGRAFVSLVAFTMRRMRPRQGGRLAACLFRPIANHPFLNVRTYVRQGDEVGIYFLAEWLPNALSLLLGPRSFGLPYRLGRIDYGHHFPRADGRFAGQVVDRLSGAAFRYRGAPIPAATKPEPCPEGSLEAWLMERYIAFTQHRGRSRYFRVWHPPWCRSPVKVEILNQDLLNRYWPWMAEAELIGAGGAPGFKDVWMGLPMFVAGS